MSVRRLATTLRMTAELEEPSEGDIRMDGKNIDDVDACYRDVAMMFQGYALYPNMNLYENIRFPLRMRSAPKSEHPKLEREAAKMVELGAFLDRKPGALSGGQRQRAALARAIVRHPCVFLMGEPLSNLVKSRISEGSFLASGISVHGVEIEGSKDAMLGIRPEDCSVGAEAVNLRGEVYGVEPTGDATFLTVKADRSYKSELGATESVAFDSNRIYFFYAESGKRIR